jgi:VWFA-related protein
MRDQKSTMTLYLGDVMLRQNACIGGLASVLISCLCFSPVNAIGQGRGTGSGGSRTSTTSSATRSSIAGNTASSAPTFLSNIPTVHAEDESTVEFRSETILVQVPVVVTDKSGNHVLNLKKDDFQVLENGKEQKITTFEEVITDKSPLPAPPAHRDEYSNLAVTPGEQPHSITVIALDTVNTPLLDQTYARKELLRYLAQNLDASQVFGLVVISGRGLKVVQGLTGDSKRLVEALNKVTSEMPASTGISTDAQAAAVSGDVPQFNPSALLNGGDALGALQDFVTQADAPIAGFQQDRAVETTMQAFLGIAWSLSGFPGKKAVIWTTGGMPFYMDSPSTVPGGYLSALYERTMAALNESEISVYPVDARGLLNFMPTADSTSPHLARDMRPDNAMKQVSSRSWLNYATTDTLRDFAAMTGGRAFYNSNDISGLFKRAVDDSSAYYLLGYYLDTKNTKPGWRQLKVKLKQKEKEAEVRARSGFFVTNATANPDITRKGDLDFAVLSPFDSTGLPVTVRWLGMSADGTKKKVQFGLQLPPNALTLGSENLLNFDYMAMAYAAKDGKKADSFGKTIRGNIPAERVAQLQVQGLGFKNELKLAPGAYTVRFIVRDNVTGRVGSVSAPLTVN